VNYYQWGFDRDSSNTTISTVLVGETKNSYYDFFLPENINDTIDPYRYWCETSFDGNCWTRSYLYSDYPVDIDEFDLGKVDVWPVPFEGEINVSSKGKMKTVVLIDMFGKEIKRVPANGVTKFRLENLESLPPGSYVLQVTYENGMKSNHKIVHLR
jgi:hypothetical protein